MVEIQIAYQGELRCLATHGPSGNQLTTDAPVDNMGKGEAFSPTDLVATALGSCMLTIVGIVANRHGFDVSGARVTVQKEMISQPVRRIGRLITHVRIPTGHQLSGDDRQRIENAVFTCPVHKSLHPEIQIPVTFSWE